MANKKDNSIRIDHENDHILRIEDKYATIIGEKRGRTGTNHATSKKHRDVEDYIGRPDRSGITNGDIRPGEKTYNRTAFRNVVNPN